MQQNHLSFVARRAATRALFPLAIAGIAAALIGCTSEPQLTNHIAFDYRQRHPIAIKEKARTLHLFVSTSQPGLTALQRADVLAFAHDWKSEGRGRIIIELPAGARQRRAANEALREIRSIFAAVDIPSHSVAAQTRPSSDAGKLIVIKVIYPHIAAEAGPCGLWPDDLGPSNDPKHFENTQYWNFGCATQRNLAAMAANPSDLLQPRPETPAYTARRSVVLDKFRKGEGSATIYQQPDKGAISDIGK